VVTVPAGEDSQEAQPMPQNHDHDQQEEEDNEQEEEDGYKAEGEEDEDYTPWSNAEKDEIFHDADEIKTFGDQASIPTGRLRDLLNHLNITTPLKFRIKRILRPGREEYKAIVEIISGPNVLGERRWANETGKRCRRTEAGCGTLLQGQGEPVEVIGQGRWPAAMGIQYRSFRRVKGGGELRGRHHLGGGK
jgi:hypothetical protein